MNYTTAENLIDKNPEAAKRFYDLEFKDHCRTLKEIQDFDTKKELNPFWNIINDLKTDCLKQSNKCQDEIQRRFKESSKKRMKVFKENPELVKLRLELKNNYLESYPDYDKFVRWSGHKISKETYNNINVKGSYAETLKNLYKLLK